MGISLFAGICWKRANRHGAFASLAVSSAVFFYLSRVQFGKWLNWDAANFGIALAAGFLVMVAVSLLTRPESEHRVQEFFERLDTRSELDPATGQETVIREPGHDLLIVHLLNPGFKDGWRRFYERFRVDINGLLVAFGVVGLLIALAKGLLYLP
jgi:hypothetical protein